MPDCDQSTIADCPYGSHSRLQQLDHVCPLPPLLHRVVAPRMCQPVHRLVWTGDSLCSSATSVLRCRRSHSQAQTRLGGEPPNARPQGSPLIWQPGGEQQARGKADTRTMLLRPASNHRIPLCSPNTAPPRDPLTAPQDP
ncbi:Long-chain-fatty-acid--CoA ligase [Giardia duodenalis]|uniref:Long-chain-fatty-acid--CoA ligase n=1 Tax=Giardia intestinalis TaxID=5741 RepID=V6TLS7_GIAIN|nr:Long-chain-fatty-acid--CoA ligase [Giardia intestinalis]